MGCVYAARLYGYGIREVIMDLWCFAGATPDVQPALAHRGLPTTPDAGACDCMLYAGARAVDGNAAFLMARVQELAFG